jgi:hypothetical protein
MIKSIKFKNANINPIKDIKVIDLVKVDLIVKIKAMI